jgi:hypothetical protein
MNQPQPESGTERGLRWRKRPQCITGPNPRGEHRTSLPLAGAAAESAPSDGLRPRPRISGLRTRTLNCSAGRVNLRQQLISVIGRSRTRCPWW